MSLRLKFWGVRGSLPSNSPPIVRRAEVRKLFQQFFAQGYKSSKDISSFLQDHSLTDVAGYGTATTCVEVNSEKQRIIIDGGSGIRNLGDEIAKEDGLKDQFHIFMTHFHWDHLIGLPFFPPHFTTGAEITYYSVEPNLSDLIRGKFRKPYFPVPFDDLMAKIKFQTLAPRRPFKLADMTVTPYLLDHPDPCWGYRIESDGKSYAHCVDTECTRVSVNDLGADLPLYTNADLMYFDAQYTLPELAEKANWGHSAAQIGLDLAYRENIKRVLFCHHDPGASTKQIDDLVRQTQEYEKTTLRNHIKSGKKVPWSFAHEGLEIKL